MYSTHMEWVLITTRREGRVIPQWQFAGGANRTRARVYIEQRYQRDLNRYMPVAKALDSAGQRELLDVKLIDLSGDRLVLGGFERVETLLGPADYIQSWVLLMPQDQATDRSDKSKD